MIADQLPITLETIRFVFCFLPNRSSQNCHALLDKHFLLSTPQNVRNYHVRALNTDINDRVKIYSSTTINLEPLFNADFICYNLNVDQPVQAGYFRDMSALNADHDHEHITNGIKTIFTNGIRDYLSSEVDVGLISIEWYDKRLKEEAFDDDNTLVVHGLATLDRGKAASIPKAVPNKTASSAYLDIELQSDSLERDKTDVNAKRGTSSENGTQTLHAPEKIKTVHSRDIPIPSASSSKARKLIKTHRKYKITRFANVITNTPHSEQSIRVARMITDTKVERYLHEVYAKHHIWKAYFLELNRFSQISAYKYSFSISYLIVKLR